MGSTLSDCFDLYTWLCKMNSHGSLVYSSTCQLCPNSKIGFDISSVATVNFLLLSCHLFLLHLPMILHPSTSLPASCSSCTLWQMVFENKNSLWHFWKAFGRLENVVVVCTFFISLSVLINLDSFPYQVCQMLFHGLMYLVLWSIAISNCQWHLYLLDRTWRG